MTKVIEKVVDIEQFPWLYGHTLFEDGMNVLFMQLCPEYALGQKVDKSAQNFTVTNDNNKWIIE